jgi:S1-C subfamily serine protease
MGVCGQCPDNEYCKDNEPVKRKRFFSKPKKDNKEDPKVEVKEQTPLKSITPSPPKSLSTKELFQRTRDSVVLIMSFDDNYQPLAIGSGFYVDDGTKIATNLHVVSDALIVRVKNHEGKVFKANVLLGVDSTHDLAMLEANISGKPIPLSQRTPEIGEDVIAIGNPKGVEATLSRGIVSGVRNDQGSVFYQVTAPISPGSSGGPVIDVNGEAIGVSTFYVQGGQNLNFAMPSDYINKLLKFPSRKTLASISKREPSLTIKVADENVKIVDYVVDGAYDRIQGSIYNGNTFSIKNIRLIVIYYSKQSGQYPVHYKLLKYEDVVPSGLSLRFSERDFKIEHGWKAKFRILDYDIVQQSVDVVR